MVGGPAFHKGARELKQPTAALRDNFNAVALWAGLGAGISFLAVVASIMLASLQGDAQGGSIAFSLLSLFILGGVAIKYGRLGWQQKFPLVVPPRAPPKLPTIEGLEAALHEGILPAYEMAPTDMKKIRRMLGKRLGYGTRPAQRAGLRANGAYGVAGLALFFLLVAGIFATAFAVAGAVPTAMVAVSAALAGLLGIAILAVMFVWASGEWKEVETLFPAVDPEINVIERLGTVQGAGDPFVLKSELEQKLMAIRNRGLPNRVHTTGWQMPTMTLDESGRIEGRLAIENHPEYTPVELHPSAHRFASRAQLPMIAAALSAITFMPYMLVAAPVGLAAVIACSMASARSMRNAVTMAERFRWKSVILYVQIEGSVGKSQIVAGRGREDSFESRNTVVRSDCQVKLYSASAVTESTGVEGTREIIGLASGGPAVQVMEMAVQAVQSFEKAGVRIRTVELTDHAVNTTAKANLAMSAERRRAVNSARGQGALPSSDLADAAERLSPGESEHVEQLGQGEAPGPPGPEDPDATEALPEHVGGFGDEPAVIGRFGDTEVHAAPTQRMARAPRSMRMRCPKCGRVNEFQPKAPLQCGTCGFAKYA